MKMLRKWAWLPTLLVVLTGCNIRRHPMEAPIVSNSKQPDKELFERAVNDLEHSKFGPARLILQTLLNTYPDSEYLAKAKLAIADSWYREGGSSSLAQAESEYKDFITFFPTMPEAGEAQMRVAMIHYREMEKPDRDTTHARRAEQEFQRLLLNYPDGPFAALAVQRLREVQEVLAQGQFQVARFYYIQGADRAVQPRLKELTDRYPNFSLADESLFMLGKSHERARGKNESPAAEYYARVVRDYPLSDRAEDAKRRLTEMKAPVPEPDPAAVARMTYERSHKEVQGFRDHVMGAFRSRPSVLGAVGKTGSPTMTAQGPAQASASQETRPPSEPRSTPGTNTIQMEDVTDQPSK